ncbi:hypothetical protein HanIR_Chr08g0382151 [Helianthus annuus]|nr:hypothetical protein HanIR_Chr08g0382151 [Helianthus annuus]
MWQGHGPGKFFGRSVNFPHFDQNFLYILCLARACPGFFWWPCLSALAHSTGKIRHCCHQIDLDIKHVTIK